MVTMRRKQTVIVVLMLMLTFSALTEIQSLISATANPEQFASIVLAMPEEYINYTITRANDTLWAKIDGVYPIRVLNISSTVEQCVIDELPMVYPTPPGTTNIHIKLNGTELAWSNYTEAYPGFLHHTAIGDWPMIFCSISPVSDYFLLTIHYEHPLEAVNGSYLFLYDLNISPYLSTLSNISTAYFEIRLETEYSHLKVYTAENDTTWNSKNFVLSSEGGLDVVHIQMLSVLGEPLAGDLVVTLKDSSMQAPEELQYWLIIVPILVFGIVLLIYFRKRKR